MNTNKAAAIEPWLTISNGQQALAFYKSAFGAVETYRLENPDGGFVVRLSIYNAGFWISSEADSDDKEHQALGGDNLRLVLVVDDPDILFAQAIEAGATEIFPVGEEHGWRLGRLSDPFGLHWEIGHMLAQ